MGNDRGKPPDWAPENGGDAFAVSIRKGVAGGHDGLSSTERRTEKSGPVHRAPSLTTADHVAGVLERDRGVLARTITLIESNAPRHQARAREVLNALLPHAGGSLRIGITGVPGAGKSTLIETFGLYLIKQGHRVAVLAVDPSSSVTRGSILGDKTRMEKLSRSQECFIRPSPSGGTLGGVARKSRETILVCEAAGFDVILVETVGVGQSEITVRSMVDFFLLLMIAGAGDELQGIKKGVVEIADALVVNKADGDNRSRAEAARSEYALALKYLTPATPGWQPRATTVSALTGDGVPEIWHMITAFMDRTRKSGVFAERRRRQAEEWVFALIEEHLKNTFYQDPRIQAAIPQIRRRIDKGEILPTAAAEHLLNLFASEAEIKG
ncbi:MAG: methylmalonyl Co-A mutase-associated GTPase MeaB [Acidobacteriota bacterium]|jgi:LAO/AO transport system kinase|nr:methylmalonyl Co-A mutase-associated GTPase MeaB [Acidobacteriota bacterium]